jgi:hypothetical protein
MWIASSKPYYKRKTLAFIAEEVRKMKKWTVILLVILLAASIMYVAADKKKDTGNANEE